MIQYSDRMSGFLKKEEKKTVPKNWFLKGKHILFSIIGPEADLSKRTHVYMNSSICKASIGSGQKWACFEQRCWMLDFHSPVFAGLRWARLTVTGHGMLPGTIMEAITQQHDGNYLWPRRTMAKTGACPLGAV